MAGKEEGLPSARAGAPDRDLAIVGRICAQPRDRAFGVADHLGIGDAALGADLGGDVVGFAFAGAVIEVMADRQIAVMREPAGGLAVELVPAGRVMNEHNAGEGPGTQRPRGIGRDRLVLVAVDRNRLCNHAFVGHSCLPWSTRKIIANAAAAPGPSPGTRVRRSGTIPARS